MGMNFTLSSLSAFILAQMGSIWLIQSLSNASSIGWPAFNNSDLITAIQQSIFSTAISLDPNAHQTTTIAPEWPSWTDAGQVMLFNETEAGQPEAKLVASDSALLERCAYVSRFRESYTLKY